MKLIWEFLRQLAHQYVERHANKAWTMRRGGLGAKARRAWGNARMQLAYDSLLRDNSRENYEKTFGKVGR